MITDFTITRAFVGSAKLIDQMNREADRQQDADREQIEGGDLHAASSGGRLSFAWSKRSLAPSRTETVSTVGRIGERLTANGHCPFIGFASVSPGSVLEQRGRVEWEETCRRSLTKRRPTSFETGECMSIPAVGCLLCRSMYSRPVARSERKLSRDGGSPGSERWCNFPVGSVTPHPSGRGR